MHLQCIFKATCNKNIFSLILQFTASTEAGGVLQVRGRQLLQVLYALQSLVKMWVMTTTEKHVNTNSHTGFAIGANVYFEGEVMTVCFQNYYD